MPALRQKIKLEYEVDGKTEETIVEYTATDVRAWEDWSGKSGYVENTSYSQLTWIAHHAAVRLGLIDGQLKSYQAFDEVCSNVEGVRKDPTKAEATAPKATRKRAGADSSAD